MTDEMVGSPYRTPSSQEAKRSQLVFHDARVSVAVVFMLALVGLWIRLIEFPRKVSVHCTPVEESIHCNTRSTIPGIPFAETRTRATLTCKRGSWDDEPRRSDHLEITLDYRGGGPRSPKKTNLMAKCGMAQTDLTEGHTGRTSLSNGELLAFGESLRAGDASRLSYEMGWGNWILAVMLAVLLVPGIMLLGRRTRIVVERPRGLVIVERHPWLLSSPTRRTFLLTELAGVTVEKPPQSRLTNQVVVVLVSGGHVVIGPGWDEANARTRARMLEELLRR